MALESAQDSDSVAAIFRSMHTIKATSGFFGFALVEQVGHVAENLLGRIRSRLEQLTEERDEAQEAIAPSVGAASTVSASVAVMTVIAPRNRNARFHQLEEGSRGSIGSAMECGDVHHQVGAVQCIDAHPPVDADLGDHQVGERVADGDVEVGCVRTG